MQSDASGEIGYLVMYVQPWASLNATLDGEAFNVAVTPDGAPKWFMPVFESEAAAEAWSAGRYEIRRIAVLGVQRNMGGLT